MKIVEQLASFIERKFFYMVAIVASLMLSVFSFYTTYNGLTDYLQNSTMAFLGTFGVQSLVFVMSWLVAAALTKRQYRSATGFFSFFLLGAGLSIFFSYADLYGTFSQSESSRDARAQRAATTASFVAIEINQNLLVSLDGRAQQAFEDLRASQEYVDWRREAERAVQTARDYQPAVAAELNRRQADAAARTSNLERQLVTAEGEVTRIEAQVTRASETVVSEQESLDALENELRLLTIDIAAKRAALQSAEANAAAEEGGVDGRPAGRGPRYDEQIKIASDLSVVIFNLEDQRRRLEIRIETQREIIARAEERRLRVEADRTAAEEALAQVRGDLEAAQDGPLGNTATGTVATVTGIADAFEEALTRFDEQRDAAALSEARQRCQDLADILASFEQTRQLPANCNAGDYTTYANALQQVNERITTFQDTCPTGSPQGDTFDSIVAASEECIATSGVPATVSRPLTDRLFQLGVQYQSEDKVSVAVQAFQDGDRNANTAAAIAILVDFLVLFVAIGGRKIQQVSDASRAGLAGRPAETFDFDPSNKKHVALREILDHIHVTSRNEYIIDVAKVKGDPRISLMFADLQQKGMMYRKPAGSILGARGDQLGETEFVITNDGYREIIATFASDQPGASPPTPTFGVDTDTMSAKPVPKPFRRSRRPGA